jgi:hypothetical protein
MQLKFVSLGLVAVHTESTLDGAHIEAIAMNTGSNDLNARRVTSYNRAVRNPTSKGQKVVRNSQQQDGVVKMLKVV